MKLPILTRLGLFIAAVIIATVGVVSAIGIYERANPTLTLPATILAATTAGVTLFFAVCFFVAAIRGNAS